MDYNNQNNVSKAKDLVILALLIIIVFCYISISNKSSKIDTLEDYIEVSKDSKNDVLDRYMSIIIEKDHQIESLQLDNESLTEDCDSLKLRVESLNKELGDSRSELSKLRGEYIE